MDPQVAAEGFGHLIILVGGKFQSQVFSSVQLAADTAYNILVKNGDGCECLHTIRDSKNNILWKYENGVGASLARLFTLIHKDD